MFTLTLFYETDVLDTLLNTISFSGKKDTPILPCEKVPAVSASVRIK